nr:hypothetical protein [Tanacetum cinerariifolium]
MVIKNLDLEPKSDAMMRDFLNKETGSKILPSRDGSCWKTFKLIASLIMKRHHFVPIGELDGVSIAFVARFGVISKSTDMISFSMEGFTATLAVLITGASQSRQHGMSEPFEFGPSLVEMGWKKWFLMISFRSRRKSMSAIRWPISHLVATELMQLSSWWHNFPRAQGKKRKE